VEGWVGRVVAGSCFSRAHASIVTRAHVLPLPPLSSPSHARRIFSGGGRSNAQTAEQPKQPEAAAAVTSVGAEVAKAPTASRLEKQLNALDAALRCGALTDEQYAQAAEGARQRAK
jgi:hypothetical protein